MNGKILFVDDEPAVLEGYKRTLHRDFHPDTANGGQEGLALIAAQGPYAVVVSDMRMPGMDGVQFLSRVREISPNSVRVILTGYADLQSAMNAVNEGNIFRFLTKPCETEVLKKALTTCLIQYQLITAEKELLENTLMGSIKVLTDVLSLSNPAAFGRSMRVRRYVQHIVAKLGLDSPWKYEVAAMLSQLGCVTLESELIDAAYCGQKLTAEDQARFNMHPSVAKNLLNNIPRLEGVAWIIGQQQDGAAMPDDHMGANMKLGAGILRVALALDNLAVQGMSHRDALAKLKQDRRYDPKLLTALEDFKHVAGEKAARALRISDLMPGMVLQEEIKTKSGILLVAKGQEVTYPLRVRLENYRRRQEIPEKIMVLVPSGDRVELPAAAIKN
jgi:response regulator RpfG family c-di-GMP phosphodiesterase